MLLASSTVYYLIGVFRQVTVVQSSFTDQFSPSFPPLDHQLSQED